MATAKKSERQQIEQILTCPICLEIFTEPRNLPCYHTFCMDCLHGLPKIFENHLKGFACPVCRVFCPDGKYGRQYVVDEFLDVYRTRLTSTKLCEVCEKHEHVAEWHCIDCKIYMCNDCHNGHKKIPSCKGHKFRSTEDDDFTVDRYVFCQHHEDQIVQLYCVHCKVPICLVCKSTNHDKHDAETIDSALQKIIPEFNIQLRAIERNIESLQAGRRFFTDEITTTKAKFVQCETQLDQSSRNAIANENKAHDQKVKKLVQTKESEIALAQDNYEKELKRIEETKKRRIATAIKECDNKIKEADQNKGSIIAKIQKHNKEQANKLQETKHTELQKLDKARDNTEVHIKDKQNVVSVAKASLENVKGSSLMKELCTGLQTKVVTESVKTVSLPVLNITIPKY